MADNADSLLNSSTGRKAVSALPGYKQQVTLQTGGIQPAFGAQALGSAISRLGQVADQGMDEVGRREYQQAALDGAKAGFDVGSTTAPAALGAKLPQDSSAYSDAFRRGAVQAASAQVGLQARASVLDLADKYRLDPTGFGQAAEASMRGFVGGLPPELRDTALDHYSGWTYRALGQISDRWHEQQRGQQRATISEAIGTFTADTGALAAQGDAPGTLDSFAKAKDQIDGAVANGILSPEEGQKTLEGLHNQAGMSYLRGLLNRAADPEATVRGLKDGKTGDEVGDAILGMLPQDKRLELISKAEVEAKDRRLQSDAAFRNQFNQQIATDPLAALETAKNYGKQNRAREYAALASVENATGDPSAVSGRGAVGRMQVEPGAARDAAKALGNKDLDGLNDDQVRSYMLAHPDAADKFGQTYYDQMLDRFDDNRTLARAAYNAGPTTVEEWVKKFGDPRKGEVTDDQFAARIPYEQTRGYVVKVANAAGPEDKTAALAIKSAMGQAAKFAQADLYERQKGELTSRMNGAPVDNAISEAEIRKAYPSPLGADKAVDRWRRSAAVADATGMLPGSSLQARQATLAAMRPTDGGDTEGWDRYNALAKAVQADNEKLLGDPGAYARDKSPRVQQALAAAQGDPKQMAAAIGQSIAYQEHMGLNPEQVRPLPKDTVTALVTQYKEAPRIEDRLGTVGFVAQLPDAVAGRVMAQLKGAGLPKGTEFAVALAQEGDTANATELATRLSMDAGKEADFTELKSRDIEKAVDASLADPSSPARAMWSAAQASGQPIDREQVEEMRTTVLRVAKQYAREPGESEDGAAQRAVSLVLGNRKVVGYEGLGTVRVPPGTDGNAFQAGMEAIRGGLDLSHVAPTEGMVRAMLGPQASAGEVQGALNAATRDHDALERWFRTEGTWVNAPGGYALVGPHGGAVPNPDGTTRVWTADEVAGAARRSTTGTGMQPTYDPVRPLS